jgi:hypothetical protein
VLYLDAAVERIDDEFRLQVEAARMGAIFAQDGKQYTRWDRGSKHKPRGLTGAALEAAVMSIAQMFPGNIVRERRQPA